MKVKAKAEFSIWNLFAKDCEIPSPFDEWSIAERVSDWIEEQCQAKMANESIYAIRIETRNAGDLSFGRIEVSKGYGGSGSKWFPCKTCPSSIAQARKAMPKWLRDLLDEADEQEFKFDESE